MGKSDQLQIGRIYEDIARALLIKCEIVLLPTSQCIVRHNFGRVSDTQDGGLLGLGLICDACSLTVSLAGMLLERSFHRVITEQPRKL